MITEDFCSFEVSKLLKEKGFDELCIFKYNSEGVRMKAGVAIDEWQNSELDDDECSCPSQSMVMKWLREVHGIFIAINNDDLDFNWQCYDLINRGSALDPKILSESYAGYKTYEKTVEAALKYSLENLL